MPDTPFKHNDPDSYHGIKISLHDCIAEKITFEDNILTFYFPDGICITPNHEASDLDYTFQTDAAEAVFHVDSTDDIYAEVFGQTYFRKTYVTYWNIRDLMKAVNIKGCGFEFLYQYRSFHEQLWECELRYGKKPYSRTVYLHIPGATASFFWNNLLPDHEW